MRRIALAALACAAFSAGAGQSASAADLAVKAPRVAAPIQYADWSGVYVGIEGGYGWGRQSGDASVPFNNFRDWCFDRDLGCGSPSREDFFDFLSTLRYTDAVFPNGSIGSTKQKGWLGGGFAGVQKQWGMWVLGVEADFDAADIKGTSVISNVLNFQPSNEDERLQISHDVSVSSKIDQLGSVRGKIGFVPTPNLLLYGTGGMAFAHVNNTVIDTQTINYWDVKDLANGDSDAVKFYSKTSSTTSGGGTMLGWAAGVGGDWKFPMDQGSSLVLGVQYLHYQFPTNTFTLTDSGGGVTAFNRSQSVDTIKGRLSYLFAIH